MIRVLHVATAMHRGGLEVWLMNILRRVDRSRYQLDVLVQTDKEARFDRELLGLGSKLLRGPRAREIMAFSRFFLKTLRQDGPYDIVHSHVHHFSGVVAALARLAGVRVVIAHSHSAAYADRRQLGLRSRLYLWATEQLIRAFCRLGIGCSSLACRDLLPAAWQGTARERVLLCGIDLGAFGSTRPDGTSGGKKQLIHVGRFNPPKNHLFLIAIVAELAKLRRDFNVVLVGSGPLAEAARHQAEALGVAALITFAGDRDDVASLLESSDLFVFPSRYEGLGLALVEAQAAGLRCLVSGTVPREADVVAGLVTRKGLEEPAATWAAAATALLDLPATDRVRCRQAVADSGFNIDRSLDELCSIYEDLLRPAHS